MRQHDTICCTASAVWHPAGIYTQPWKLRHAPASAAHPTCIAQATGVLVPGLNVPVTLTSSLVQAAAAAMHASGCPALEEGSCQSSVTHWSCPLLELTQALMQALCRSHADGLLLGLHSLVHPCVMSSMWAAGAPAQTLSGPCQCPRPMRSIYCKAASLCADICHSSLLQATGALAQALF